jgi:hypothetical protein
MMRGAEMVFAAVLAVVFLHRALNKLHFMGIGCCICGICLVGLSSVLAGEGGTAVPVTGAQVHFHLLRSLLACLSYCSACCAQLISGSDANIVICIDSSICCQCKYDGSVNPRGRAACAASLHHFLSSDQGATGGQDAGRSGNGADCAVASGPGSPSHIRGLFHGRAQHPCNEDCWLRGRCGNISDARCDVSHCPAPTWCVSCAYVVMVVSKLLSLCSTGPITR